MEINGSEVVHQIKRGKEGYCERLGQVNIGFIHRGQKRVYEKGEYTVVSEGQAFILRRGIYFVEDIPSSGLFEQTIFHIDSQDIFRTIERLTAENRLAISALIRNDFVPRNIYTTEANFYLNLLFSKEWTSSSCTDQIASNAARHRLDLLISSIILDTDSPLRKALLSEADTAQNRFQSVVQSSILDPECTLNDLARRTNNSRTAFKLKFAKIYSTSPHKWIIDHRLEMSLPLLLATDDQISEVAAKCGFADTSHYIRLFKSRYKTTPKAYRQAHRAEAKEL